MLKAKMGKRFERRMENWILGLTNGMGSLRYVGRCVGRSVTRFGEISPLCQNFESLWAIFGMSHLVFGKLLSRLWHFYATGQLVILVNGYRLNSNKAISCILRQFLC